MQEKRKLSAADLALLLRIRSAPMDYENEDRLGGPALEPRFMICGVRASRRCC